MVNEERIKRLKKYYDIVGDGVAHLKIKEAKDDSMFTDVLTTLKDIKETYE